jgi:hypothetical protein
MFQGHSLNGKKMHRDLNKNQKNIKPRKFQTVPKLRGLAVRISGKIQNRKKGFSLQNGHLQYQIHMKST